MVMGHVAIMVMLPVCSSKSLSGLLKKLFVSLNIELCRYSVECRVQLMAASQSIAFELNMSPRRHIILAVLYVLSITEVLLGNVHVHKEEKKNERKKE